MNNLGQVGILFINSTYMQWFNWIQIFCDLAEFLRWHIKHVSSLKQRKKTNHNLLNEPSKESDLDK